MSIRDTDLWKSETYYIYYLDNLYTILQDNNIGYSWERVEDCEIYCVNQANWEGFNNPFLDLPKDNVLSLALDILERGTYAPICAEFRGISPEGKKRYVVFSGSHRITVLKQLSTIRDLGRSFLFIYPLGDGKLEKPIELYSWNCNSRHLGMTSVDNYHSFRDVMDKLISGMNWYFKESNLPPSPILNNEELFERYLSEGILNPIL